MVAPSEQGTSMRIRMVFFLQKKDMLPSTKLVLQRNACAVKATVVGAAAVPTTTLASILAQLEFLEPLRSTLSPTFESSAT
mmetsp:Transcript_120570/g.240070  ORF Transcript_120570/g.240070 Transcript_120570/m.240070 type:complete len:81 (-) Transcript_120570:46-288(-)